MLHADADDDVQQQHHDQRRHQHVCEQQQGRGSEHRGSTRVVELPCQPNRRSEVPAPSLRRACLRSACSMWRNSGYVGLMGASIRRSSGGGLGPRTSGCSYICPGSARWCRVDAETVHHSSRQREATDPSITQQEAARQRTPL